MFPRAKNKLLEFHSIQIHLNFTLSTATQPTWVQVDAWHNIAFNQRFAL